MTERREVVIIGSGPAGLTAAIYTARANLHPVVLEGEPSSTSDQPGGQLMLTTDVENYPGFPQGVMGPDLMVNFRAQAERFGAEIRTVKASKVDFSSRPHKVWVGDTEAEPTYEADTVIIATGAQSLMLGLEGENRLMGNGLSTCATCDGFFFRDQDIAVVGGGDSAVEEATFLTRFAKSVTLIHRRDTLRASAIMQDRVFANDKMKFLWDSTVTDIIGENKVEAIEVQNLKSGETTTIPMSGLFIAIGHRPNTDIFKGQITLKDNGYILTDPRSTATNIEGVFACGDVQDDYYRQAITAAGSGCAAAIDAERYLESIQS